MIEHEKYTRNYPQSRLPPISANAPVPQIAYPLVTHSFHSKSGIGTMKRCGQQRWPGPCVRLLHRPRLGPCPVPSQFCLPNQHDKQPLLKNPLIRRPIFHNISLSDLPHLDLPHLLARMIGSTFGGLFGSDNHDDTHNTGPQRTTPLQRSISGDHLEKGKDHLSVHSGDGDHIGDRDNVTRCSEKSGMKHYFGGIIGSTDLRLTL